MKSETISHRYFSVSSTVDEECDEFKDEDTLYQFVFDAKEAERPGDETYTEEELDDVLIMLSRSGPDAQLRMALRKP